MVNNLKSLIIRQVRDVFGNIKVYDETVKQGLETPAFQVLIFNTHNERLFARRVSRTYSFNVNYFPRDSDNVRNECDEVLETFQNEFMYIADKFHIHEIEGVVSDDVLVMTFNVNAHLSEMVKYVNMMKLGGVSIGEKTRN